VHTLGDADVLTWGGASGGSRLEAGDLLVATARSADLAGFAPTLLSADEFDRSRQFRVAADRDRFFAAHALKRRLLGVLLGVPGAQLRFERQWAGKPQLVGRELHFNLSHSGDWVVLAISRSAPVGVDIEQGDSALPEGMLSLALHPDDRLAREPDSLVDRFYTAWTLKEAVSKGVGIGLALPFTQLRLEPSAPTQYRCRHGDELWHAEHRKLEGGAHLAVACLSPWTRLRLLRIERGI
jgi:phosphopantetheinyl transferase